MQYKKRTDLDIILDLLNAVLAAKPDSEFTQSLMHQYMERGSLSKKQLQGLHSKASKIKDIPVAKLASLEATILKMPTRFKSEAPKPAAAFVKDEATGNLISDILTKFPAHKRVLFFQAKYNNNETLNATELSELSKFHKLLMSK